MKVIFHRSVSLVFPHRIQRLYGSSFPPFCSGWSLSLQLNLIWPPKIIAPCPPIPLIPCNWDVFKGVPPPAWSSHQLTRCHVTLPATSLSRKAHFHQPVHLPPQTRGYQPANQPCHLPQWRSTSPSNPPLSSSLSLPPLSLVASMPHGSAPASAHGTSRPLIGRNRRRSPFWLVEEAEAEAMAVLRPDPATGPPTQHVGQTSTQTKRQKQTWAQRNE